jgi:hypothetical protein
MHQEQENNSVSRTPDAPSRKGRALRQVDKVWYLHDLPDLDQQRHGFGPGE